jgi:hypothetical protein
MRTHNIGFDRPRLTHKEWVEYLFECAHAWRWKPNGETQANRIKHLAELASKQTEETCDVCLAALRIGQAEQQESSSRGLRAL